LLEVLAQRLLQIRLLVQLRQLVLLVGKHLACALVSLVFIQHHFQQVPGDAYANSLLLSQNFGGCRLCRYGEGTFNGFLMSLA